MLDNTLSTHLFSIFTVTFLSLARWSLERDEPMGSSMRFGDRGLLFYAFLLGFIPFIALLVLVLTPSEEA